MASSQGELCLPPYKSMEISFWLCNQCRSRESRFSGYCEACWLSNFQHMLPPIRLLTEVSTVVPPWKVPCIWASNEFPGFSRRANCLVYYFPNQQYG